MKHRILITAILAMGLTTTLKSQDNPCENGQIRRQIDSLKSVFQNKGFIIIQEASVAMESENELPVIVPLKMGTSYEVIFIGDQHSQSYEMSMYDYNEKQVLFRRSNFVDQQNNIIACSYIPNMSEYHMIKPVQFNSNQKKNLCGYILLLKKG